MKISVITVSYNSAATIRDTLGSVASQDYPDIEHIVIDGASVDNTVEIVRQFPHITKLVSEKDNGLYDAMNKGIKLSTGDVIGILNSDDIYANPTVLSKIATRFSDKHISACYGDLQYVHAKNPSRVVRTWRSSRFKPSDFYYGWMPPHPTFFVRREVYNSSGLFNTSLFSASDYEMMLRLLFKNRLKATYIPEILIKMRAGGVSNSSLRQRILANKEDRQAWKINDLRPYFFTLYLKPLRKIFQFLLK